MALTLEQKEMFTDWLDKNDYLKSMPVLTDEENKKVQMVIELMKRAYEQGFSDGESYWR